MKAVDLLEREQCLSSLAEWLTAATEHNGGIVLVAGEAGIGKSTLMHEFVARRQNDVRVLWGACDALFTPRPLAPLYDIARQTQGALLEAINARATREDIFSATLDELERGDPALVVFEDVHWADKATYDLIKFLGRRIQRTRVLLALTYRDDEVGPRHSFRFVIGDLPRASVHNLPLSPLSTAAVESLAQRAGRPSQGLHRMTGGNPFFVTEVLAGSPDATPTTVRDAVLARAATLSPAAREIAEFVSIVPAKTEAWLLEQGVVVDDAGIEDCLGIGMVRDEEGALAFRHELARRAFESTLSQARLQSLHAKALAILAERSDVAVARLAHHADGARNAQAVLRYAPVAAARAAAVGAHCEAELHYKAALRHSDLLAPAERAHLYEQLAYERYLTDQGEDAIEAQQAALAIWSASGAHREKGNALRWLSRLSWFAGRGEDANRYGDEAIAVLEPLMPPGRELAWAYSNRAQLEMLGGRAAAAIDWAERTIRLAERLNEKEILSHALNNLGAARLMGGDDAGWTDLERSLAIALASDFHEHAARAYTNLSVRAVSLRRYDAAFRYFGEGLAYCDKYELDSWRLYMLAWQAHARLERGEWPGAADDAQTVLRHPHTAAITRISGLTVLAHLRLRRGDPDAGSVLDEARALAARTGELQRLAPVALADADAAWLEGDRARIATVVRPVYALARTQHDPWMKGQFAVWLHRAGALEEPPSDVAEPFAQELAGDWRAAAETWREVGCPYDRAAVLAWHGGEREQLEALAILEELGAAATANALRKQMRAQGVRRIPRGSRSSTRSHPDGLTKREAQILEYLSEGLRNSAIASRLFVSTKTVDHHVSAILAKLGVPSRAEAAALARKRRDENA